MDMHTLNTGLLVLFALRVSMIGGVIAALLLGVWVVTSKRHTALRVTGGVLLLIAVAAFSTSRIIAMP
jgi:hypothetical protein